MTGQVKVYRINSVGSSWERLGQSIYGYNEDHRFRQSVDISPYGNTLAVGSPGYPRGYVRVFSLEEDGNLGTRSWKQIGQDITGEHVGDWFGFSVSLSDDAQILAVGAPLADGKNGADSGCVRVYRMDNSKSNWIQLGDEIRGEAAYDHSGKSVSLSVDGDMVAIGSIWNEDYGAESGHVRVFVL